MRKPRRDGAAESAERAKFFRDLLKLLRTREAEMARLLGRFVRAESPSDDKPALDRLARMLAGEWRSRGARVNLLPQAEAGNHLRVEWPASGASNARGDSPILLLGHLDTVYEIGTLARMPFRIRGGRAYGPGTFDMKSGLVIALFAVDALQRLGLKPRRPIVGLWTSDEEIGSHASRELIEQEARRCAAVLVLEPAARKEGKLKTARKGVGEVTLEVTGRAAHAGLDPQNGINAIDELALQIARIRSFNQPKRGITVNADVIAGGTRSNVIAEKARVLIDVRAETARDIRDLEAKFRRLRPILPGAKLAVRGGFNRPPLERKMSGGLYAEAKRLGDILGLRIDECAVGGGSDGCFTAALGVPTLDGLGGVGDRAHAANEHVLLRALPERAALLAALLLEL
jgi:glutamate carboxypeptidase